MFGKIKLVYLVGLLFIVIAGLMAASVYIIKEHASYGFERVYINMEDTSFNAYADGNVNKGSRARTINTNNEKGFDCVISHLEKYPYCVLTIDIRNSEMYGIDFTGFTEMTVVGSYTSPGNDFLRIGFRHFDPRYSKHHAANSMKFNQVEIKSKNITDSFVVDFSRLTVPAWWVAGLKNDDVDDKVDLGNIALIELSTGTLPSEGEYKLRIKYFVLEKEVISINKVYEYLLMAWAAFLMFVMVITVVILIFRLRSKINNEKILIEINNALSMKSIELEAISQTDALTGALNRVGLQKRLVNTVRKRQYPSTIIMIDIDFFKSINDEFGHQKGDYVLEHMCAVIRSYLRNDESLSRYGGEEFLILMPNLSIQEVKTRLEEIREGIQSSDMKVKRSVTASFGVAQINRNDSIKNIISEADKALYMAKNNGRNCVKIAQ